MVRRIYTKFNGKNFEWVKAKRYKRDAQKYAKQLRAYGHNARVIKARDSKGVMYRIYQSVGYAKRRKRR